MAMKPPGGGSHDLFGAEFKGTPCHHRVLKPPGGGTSDIFGAPEPLQNSPRRARNLQMQSSVFGTPASANGETSAARNKPGMDSYNRLFGPAESSRPSSAVKDRMKSNILSKDEPPSTPKEKNGFSPVEDKSSTADAPDGNPVTGEGYTNGGDKQPTTNNSSPTTNGDHSGPIARSRVPPGGYSSGLW